MMAKRLYEHIFYKTPSFNEGLQPKQTKILNKSKIPMPKQPISLKDLILHHELYPPRRRIIYNLCFL